MKSGTLIVFEGLDGCGKSTQLRRAAETLRARGVDVVETREPTDGPWGRKIREMARTEEGVSPETEFEWFFADRQDHMREVVEPAIAAGRVVLSDRSYVSSVAYQGGRGLDVSEVLAANEKEFRRPDLILLFEIPVDVGLERIESRGGVAEPAFEKRDFLERVAAIFERLDLAGLVRIDATRDEAAIARDALAAIESVLDSDGSR